MKFSKKFLTALLPIAATGAIVPAVASCQKPAAWGFSYGESINCLNTTLEDGDGAYHTLAEVRNAVKSHVSIDSTTTISGVSVLPSWSIEYGKQFLYFDLIASCCLVKQSTIKENGCFTIKWFSAGAKNEIAIKYQPPIGTVASTSTPQLEYLKGDSNEVVLHAGGLKVKSYCFQNTTIQ